ncbi:MAG: 50S ribosomal protein L21 [Actinomycetota bacterium]|nr:50S ribosomal protein L21 [Actinomycetota bacterium]
MYAVINTGGKQYRVAEGDKLEVERLGAGSGDGGDEVSFTPVLVVDGEKVLAKAGDLSGSAVKARILGDTKGPKIRGFTYKNKTNQRRRWGHRQKYSTIEISGITREQGA